MATNKTIVIGAVGTGGVIVGLMAWQHYAGTSFAGAAAAGDEMKAERAARVLAINDSGLVPFLLFLAVVGILIGGTVLQSK